MFELTQRTLPTFVLTKSISDIREQFGIDWSAVEWTDLRKPLYSALGAQLYITYKNRMDNERHSLPWSVDEQATFWNTYYRPDAGEQRFNALATKFESRE